jgi:hypothetical protein
MRINQIAATAVLGCALGAAGVGVGAGIANAAPPCPPGVQCQGGRGGGPGGPPGDFNRHGGDDWRGRFHDAPWGDGLPPWGWGAPPPPRWNGPLPPAWGPPPPPIDYFGYQEQPVWDPGYNQWGFWFFGIWIPLPI